MGVGVAVGVGVGVGVEVPDNAGVTDAELSENGVVKYWFDAVCSLRYSPPFSS